MSELDKRVQEVIDTVVEKQNDINSFGGSIPFKNSKEKLKLNKNLSLIELKRFKQEFIKISRQTPPKSIEQIGDSFINYLQSVIERL